MTLDFAEICRICLQSAKQSFDIYTNINDTIYSDMLASCTKLKPFQEDGLPRQICRVCSRTLKRTYCFNILCEESDKILKTHLENKANILTEPKTDQEEIKVLIEEEGKDTIQFDEETVQFDEETIQFNEETVQFEESVPTEIQSDVKLEPSGNEDEDHWSADDDNAVLQEIKSEKKDNEVNGDAIVKKKRGRKKIYPDGVKRQRDKRQPHQCDICGKVLSNSSNLKQHKVCHSDQRPYKCTDCKSTFKGYSALFQHRKLHTGLTPYHCEYCNKKFKRRTGYDNHVRIHTGDKRFSCELCCKTFIQSAQLSVHMKRHTGAKTFLCQDCGKGFAIQSDLTVHRRIHSGEKPYNCHLCPKTFSTSGNLSIHIRIHNKEIRYNCKECSRGFVTSSAYNVHLKRHKGQRDYHCDCGKSFYTNSSLRLHKVAHTGERKYQCKICEKRFSQSSHLNRHFKKDHARPDMPIPPSETYRVIVTGKSTTKQETVN